MAHRQSNQSIRFWGSLPNRISFGPNRSLSILRSLIVLAAWMQFVPAGLCASQADRTDGHASHSESLAIGEHAIEFWITPPASAVRLSVPKSNDFEPQQSEWGSFGSALPIVVPSASCGSARTRELCGLCAGTLVDWNVRLQI